jgi:hypothetical protein
MNNKTQTARQVIQLLNLSGEIDFRNSTFFTYEKGSDGAFADYEFLRIAPDIKIIINEKTGVLKVMKGVNIHFADGVEGLRKITFLNKFFQEV